MMKVAGWGCVELFSQQRKPKACEVDSDLMRSPCRDGHLEETGVGLLVGVQATHVRTGTFSLGCGPACPAFGIPTDSRIDALVLESRDATADREVAFGATAKSI